MFGKHVTKDLSAYCHSELPADRSRRVAEHVRECRRCADELDQIKLGIKLAEHIAEVEAPDSLWQEVERSLRGEKRAGDRSRRFAPLPWKPMALVSATAAVVLTVIAGWYLFIRTTGPWTVEKTSDGGTVMIGRTVITTKGNIGEGQRLETDSSGRARMGVGIMGEVDVDPDTRLRVLKILPREHRLYLEQGRLHATIKAPPRLFIVETPSAVATDMGCAYTLEVDAFGNGRLTVTSGWVELALRGFDATVPAEAACLTRVGFGPGTPFFEDSSLVFQEALARLDFERETAEEREATLNTLLLTSRKRDTLTLWHLLFRVNDLERERVFDRLAGFVAPPAGVTRAGALSLDEKMLKDWWADVIPSWF